MPQTVIARAGFSEEGPSVICFARKRQVIQPKDLLTPVGRHG
jgi:hypothetical protein